MELICQDIILIVFSFFDVCFFHGHQMEKQISLKPNIAYVLQKSNNSCYWNVILEEIDFGFLVQCNLK